MQIQKSFAANNSKGCLYLVPTPIGNLEDMTFRAIRILKEVDLIAAEDTRNTKKLLNYFNIDTPLTSYHEHNKESSGRKLIHQLKEGKTIALVSDAGIPCISDPGYELVQEAIKEELAVISLPGPNAALTALVASGINTQPFLFYGFLPRGKKEKKTALTELKSQKPTLIFYEAPHRLVETLSALYEILGNRPIVLCRELTKKYEEYIRGSLEEVLEWCKTETIRGEFCLIVQGNEEEYHEEKSEEWWSGLSIKSHVQSYIDEHHFTTKDAIKQTAQDRNLPKRDVYRAYHIDEME